MSKWRSVLLFGAPGAGKGTQGRILGCVPGFVHVAMGDLFRSLDPDSELGRTVQRYSSRGELVPDEITVDLLRRSVQGLVERGKFDPERDLLALDGVPRNVQQAQLLTSFIEPLLVLHLDASDEQELLRRLRKRALEEGRADDAREEVVRHRLEVYRSQTAPVLAQYPREIVVRIEAIGAPVQVLSRIAARLAEVV
ncbi:MAG: nucleoside monophosphate kinase [Planctomycetota bacterium]|nr:MAG: nucleoside monophosphate kinase [Planctomycetota bacterium]